MSNLFQPYQLLQVIFTVSVFLVPVVVALWVFGFIVYGDTDKHIY